MNQATSVFVMVALLGLTWIGQAQPAGGQHLDQHLVDALSFVRELPGIVVLRERRVEDVHSLVIKSDEVMPLFEGLGKRGWIVHMTEERLEAHKGELTIYGKFSTNGIELQVRPVSDSLDADRPFDFRPVLTRLEQGQTVRMQIGAYRSIDLLEALAEAGWRARLTKDRLTGQRGVQRLEGTIEGSEATLKCWIER